MNIRFTRLPFATLMICAVHTVTAQVNTCAVNAAIDSAPPTKAGYRVAGVRWDPLLHQRWVKLVNCAHPEQPAVAMLMPRSEQDATSTIVEGQTTSPFPAVHAGDLVRLWSADGNFLVETSGIAEMSGATGATIRVRLLRPNDVGQPQEQTVFGIVRGYRDVEIRR